jgi:Rrf2 family iron-sulfur cluster assembly transcriptional regulator
MRHTVDLGTKGRYAVMAMADLALHNSGHPVALAEIAARQDISLSYLEQLLTKLRKQEMIKSTRGPRGGYMLNKLPEEIRILDIIKAIEEPSRRRRRKNGFPVDMTTARGWNLTAELWHELDERVEEFLNSVTLDDIVNRRIGGNRQLFEVGGNPFHAPTEEGS